jgi:hypothetical protein
VRLTSPLLCALLVSGCGLGTDAALTAQDAQSALSAKDGALGRLTQTQLTLVVQAAQQWSAAHGGVLAGFADDLRSSQPSVASTLVDLTDGTATIAVGGKQCVTAQLPAGTQVAAAC